MSGEMTDFGPRHQKRSVVPKKSVRELCAPSDGSETRRQLAERADRYVDRFRIIKDVRTSVLTLCDHGHGESGHHSLGFTLWQELTQLLKGSTGQGLDRTEVTDQSRSCRFLTDKQRQMLHPR